MNRDQPSAELLARFREGDSRAADEMFSRYMARLTMLARRRLSPRMSRRLDGEDVALSAFRSFFIRARDGRFTLERSGDLWRLLVEITLRKLHRQVLHHTAQKRSVQKEEPLPEGGDSAWQALVATGAEPQASDAAAVAEILQLFLKNLPPLERTILELRLQDRPISDIAVLVDRCERTVRRILIQLVSGLRQQLSASDEREHGTG